MTNKQKILKFLHENPSATNKEIAKNLRISEGHVKTDISRLKSSGYIFVDSTDGIRTISIIRGLPAERSEYKKEIYQELLDGYLQDFREAETRTDRKEVGTLILRIVERL